MSLSSIFRIPFVSLRVYIQEANFKDVEQKTKKSAFPVNVTTAKLIAQQKDESIETLPDSGTSKDSTSEDDNLQNKENTNKDMEIIASSIIHNTKVNEDESKRVIGKNNAPVDTETNTEIAACRIDQKEDTKDLRKWFVVIRFYFLSIKSFRMRMVIFSSKYKIKFKGKLSKKCYALYGRRS